MKEDVLSEEGVDQGQVEHVSQELSQPSPEGDVNVEGVLLLPTFDDLRPQTSGRGRCVGHLDDSVEGDRVEDDLRNAEGDEVEEPFGGQAAAEDEQSKAEFEDVDVDGRPDGPVVSFFARKTSVSSS